MKNIKVFLTSPMVTAGLLFLVFFVSLMVFLIRGPEKKRVILFFPEDDYVDVAGDFHILPVRDNRSDNMKVLLGEALLEPYDFHLNETVPEGVVINSLIFDSGKNILYIDLSIEFISLGEETPRPLDGDTMLEILKKNLMFNFHDVTDVKFTVDGQVPHSHVFNGASS